ncbi:MAG: hypothetical protein AW09_000391 [Candidatus Accumulibacter phosphatis]|uniref:Uncharacterized protein n=1 Tax=Candidatus Accumulibacter phosphatis TaxID=327160 RepID=A0A080LZC5_9PROT|nr:MAG: hypothetical protein AW09_000391 [Candidatus Accumulibacter phosphatis]
MGTAVLLVRPDDNDPLHRLAILGLVRTHQARQIVGVGEGYSALAGSHRPDLIGIATFGRAGEVGNHPSCPLLGFRLPLMGNDRGHQRQVVGVGTRAGADLALQSRIGKIAVSLQLLGLHGTFGVDDDARTDGKREPVTRAQMRGNAGLQQRRPQRCKQSHLVCCRQTRGIDRQQDIRWTVGPLVADPFEQLVFLALDALDGDSGLLCEAVVQGFIGLVMAGRVQVQHLLLSLRTHKGCSGEQQADQRTGKGKVHGYGSRQINAVWFRRPHDSRCLAVCKCESLSIIGNNHWPLAGIALARPCAPPASTPPGTRWYRLKSRRMRCTLIP